MIKEISQIKFLTVAKLGKSLSWMEKMRFFWHPVLIQYLKDAEGPVFATIEYKKERLDLKRIPSNILSDSQRNMYKNLREIVLYNRTPLSAYLPISYQHISYRVRWFIASLLAIINRWRIKRKPTFPQWPLDLSSDSLEDLEIFLNGENSNRNTQGKIPVVLTHDIDTPESLKNLPNFLTIEEEFGCYSTNFIVPKKWEIDHAILESASASGHEIGVHGYNHDNKTPFLSGDRIRRRMEEIMPFIERYQVKGYRSPSLLRTENLFKYLKKFFVYDASVPTSGGLFSSKSNGCGTARPFFISNDRIIEIPLSIPSDASLLFLGYTPLQILKLWIELSNIIAKSNGVIVLLTHCEKRYSGNTAMLDVYRQFISFIANSNLFKFQRAYDVISLLCLNNNYTMGKYESR